MVLNLCSHYQTMDDQSKPMTDEQRQRILEANDAMTQDALRVLGMAYRIEKEAPGEDGELKAKNLSKIWFSLACRG